ncbi:MAG TPA: hypothetical protein VJT11_01180 [Nitrospiraceae bacterium]|nr:hypothetical protein [Nitrospiraceae bacterium]
MTDRQVYIQTVLNLYVHMPDIACPPRRSDRQLAGWFFDRHIPIELVETALLLGSARRACHSRAQASEAIRSLHYFESIIEELVNVPPPRGYIDYLRRKVQSTAPHHAFVSPDFRI